jgi:predicted DNA-binding protein with PD1-like motif
MGRIILLLFCTAALCAPQTTRREVTKSTNPQDDAKGLSPDVPECHALSTQVERVVLLRFKNQADLLAGIEKQVREQKITNGVILTGIGSALRTHYHVVSNRSFPSKNLYLETAEASADIVNINGLIMKGRVHAHITFADSEKAYGGHLEPGSRVFTFATIAIGVLPASLDLSRFDDKNWR